MNLLTRAIISFLALALSACPNSRTTDAEGRRAEIFVSVRPLRMILEALAGHHFSIVEVLPNGASPHTYEPRPSDLRRATHGRAFFFAGPSLDAWASKLEAPVRVEVLALLPKSARQEFIDPDYSLVPSLDPHFWTDPLAVKALLPALTRELCKIEAVACADFEARSHVFSAELDALHLETSRKLAPFQGSPVLLFHPSFLYFMKRYGLKLAGIIEIAPGKEPSPQNLKRLIEQARGLQARAIFSEPQFPKRPAEVIAESTHARMAELEPYGRSSTQSYAEFIRENASAFVEALR